MNTIILLPNKPYLSEEIQSNDASSPKSIPNSDTMWIHLFLNSHPCVLNPKCDYFDEYRNNQNKNNWSLKMIMLEISESIWCHSTNYSWNALRWASPVGFRSWWIIHLVSMKTQTLQKMSRYVNSWLRYRIHVHSATN